MPTGLNTGSPAGKVTSVSNLLGFNYILPTGGLYTLHTDPGTRYLVETNSKFTQSRDITSSDYMLQRISTASDITQKHLGDGFYEQKLIRDQIVELTGSQHLGSFTSSDAEFKSLMDNSITYAQQFNLRSGVALTAQQMATLTSDMVWMVEQEVQGQKVLVPVVYLAHVSANDLKPSGALIKAENVTLTAENGSLTNTGTINATNNATVTADRITNYGGTVDSGNATNLKAITGDILNQSGIITGRTVSLSADKGNIINETLISTLNRDDSSMSLVNQRAKIEARENLTVTATKGDIFVKGSQITAGNNLAVNAGRNIEITGVERQDSIKYNLEGAAVNHTITSNIASSINVGGNVTLGANQDITLQGAQIVAGGKLAISATRNLQVASLLDQEQISAKSRWNNTSYDKKTNLLTDIKAGGNVSLTTGDTMTLSGAKIAGSGDLSVAAGGNLTITAVQDETKINKQGFNYYGNSADRALMVADLQNPELQRFTNSDSRVTQQAVNFDDSKNKTSSLETTGNINITTNGDATLKGAQVNAGKDLTLQSTGGNILVTAVKDRVINEQYISQSSDRYQSNRDDETVIGSSLNASSNNQTGTGQIIISAVKPTTTNTDNASHGSVAIEGSSVHSAAGDVSITADTGKDVNITAVSEHHEALDTSHTVRSGFFSTTVTDTSKHSVSNLVSGSTISGNKVSIASGNDLTVQGSNVVGTNDVTLTAPGNINITSAKETGKDESYRYEKTFGIFGSGGFGFTIGSKSTKTTNNEQTIGEVGSTIGSIDSNVSITAGNKVTSAGTTFIAGKDIKITGKDVSIDNTVNTLDSQYKYEFKQTGLTVSLGGKVIDTATSLDNKIERSGEVQDGRLKDLYVLGAYKDYQTLHTDFNNYELFKEKYDKALDKINGVDPQKVDPNDAKAVQEAGNKVDQLLPINVSIGSSKTSYEQNTHVETVNSSNINAGGNVNITGTEGDINLKGTNITGKDIDLDAKKDLNIESAQNKQQTDSKTDSSSWSIGGSFGLGTGSFLGVIGGSQRK